MRLPPVLLIGVAIASVQLGASFAKDLFASAPPVAVAWLRLASAAVMLTVIARPRLTGRDRRQWLAVLAYGAVLTAMNYTFYLAIERIPIGMAVTFEFLGPLGVALAGSRRPRDFLWAGLALLGVALLGFTPGDLDPVGVLFALLAGALWASYIVLAGPTGRYWSGVTGVTIASWVGAITLGVPALVTAFSGAGGESGAGAGSWLADPRVWLIGCLVGLLSAVVPYGLEMVALRRIDRGVFGILMSLEPAAAAVFALLVLGEQLRPIELAAMACVIIASIGATRKVKQATERIVNE